QRGRTAAAGTFHDRKTGRSCSKPRVLSVAVSRAKSAPPAGGRPSQRAASTRSAWPWPTSTTSPRFSRSTARTRLRTRSARAPAPVSAMSVSPVCRWSRLHSVSPCLISSSSAMGSRYAGSPAGSRSVFAATVGRVRIATWNVNSVKQRIPRLLPWLDQRQPDVVCLQETKLADDAFVDLLGQPLAERGYAVAVHGEATWNGVAILSRLGLEDVVAGVDGAP